MAVSRSATRISKIEAWACTVPLTSPISFGSFEVRSRDYTALRVTLESGLTAECLGHTRGSPLDVIALDLLAPRLIGRDALDTVACVEAMRRSVMAMEQDGAIGRALSLLEVALWDLKAQSANLPLWRLLGGAPRSVPVLLVEGYALSGESGDDFVQRLVERVGEGYERLKIEAAHYADPAELRELILAFRAKVGSAPKLVLDLAWAWSSALDGEASCAAWRDLGIDWIEDVMARTQSHEIARLRRKAGIPIGIGDETSRPLDLERLVESEAIDVMRIDATTVGGIARALQLAQFGRDRGTRVSFHVNPEVHEHCVFAASHCDHIEAFPKDRQFDQSITLIHSDFWHRVERGRVSPGMAPGTGIRLDTAAVLKYAYRAGVVSDASGSQRVNTVGSRPNG